MNSKDRQRQLITVIVGTRPEVIKLAPVIRALEPSFQVRLVLTGQHTSMVDDLIAPLGLTPAARLGVMRERQTLNGLFARLTAGLEAEFLAHRPAAVIVQGDTSSAVSGALAAFHEQVPVAHVEAGLRSHNLQNPFPEEANRRLISTLATWNFAPTSGAAQNLFSEGVSPEAVLVTGNTVIDGLLWARNAKLGQSAFADTSQARRVLVTLHRRENHGPIMESLATGIASLAASLDITLVLPLHRSPAVRDVLLPVLSGLTNVRLVEPLSYMDFTATLADSELVITDSGGVQEEAPSLGVPVLVARDTTERPEAITAGCARLVGTDGCRLALEARKLLTDHAAYAQMAHVRNPFGDGMAAVRIAEHLKSALSSAVPLTSLAA